ncbi:MULTISPECIES: nicotinate (nicotinamide) nucleotide adenylyltransferase [unclassified Moraxella]|uniref:nicotinate (nicotinamide) nucleotide adenylyltransferase n=1 Tax=unclassified Moraxella TaxID=2685852 RepID=UPI002B414803|nr:MULTISPECIES: nicotinate (nicotinamide) nucleotide adenylyltransferase [unclassified Moraxella]
MNIRAFLGGSFDPVHSSHLSMALSVHTSLMSFANAKNITVSLMPTKGNPFKDKPTTDEHRLAMLHLATKNTPINIEPCELNRTPPIYTIQTVQLLKQLYPTDRLIFILGQDSLYTLPSWKNGNEILNHINIWAFWRGEFQQNGEFSSSILTNLTDDLSEFLTHDGKIYQDNTPIPPMSSSHIRHLIANKDPESAKFLPPEVLGYIHKNTLYDTTVL